MTELSTGLHKLLSGVLGPGRAEKCDFTGTETPSVAWVSLVLPTGYGYNFSHWKDTSNLSISG